MAWVLKEASSNHEDQYVFIAVFSTVEKAVRFTEINKTYTRNRGDGTSYTLDREYYMEETEMDPETVPSPNEL